MTKNDHMSPCTQASDQELTSVQFLPNGTQLYLTVRLRKLRDPLHAITKAETEYQEVVTVFRAQVTKNEEKKEHNAEISSQTLDEGHIEKAHDYKPSTKTNYKQPNTTPTKSGQKQGKKWGPSPLIPRSQLKPEGRLRILFLEAATQN